MTAWWSFHDTGHSAPGSFFEGHLGLIAYLRKQYWLASPVANNSSNENKHTRYLVLHGHNFSVRIVDDLVHLGVQVGVLLRERLGSVFLVESAKGSALYTLDSALD